MMITREQLLSSPEYWFEEAQNELYRQVTAYQEQKGINQTQLAEELGVTKGYVSQILKGDFNYTLKKLIEISLAIGQVPTISYTPLTTMIEHDRKSAFMGLRTNDPVFISLPGAGDIDEESKVAEPSTPYLSAAIKRAS